ncbi:hypothetical protein HZA76_03630 [Candidatus Roizmanbacteria bacterium]|nr:hypothetical protein [Candidatus Roizmanbacteria bacterium]
MTLTELSYKIRKLLPFLLLFALIFLIIFYSFKLLFIYLESNQEKPAIVPRIFGKISSPEVSNATSSAGFEFSLDTVEGKPLTSTDSAKVYFLPKPATRFGYREKIYLMAKTLGFDTEAVKHRLVNNMATFDDGKQLLTINIGNFNFKYESKPDSNALSVSGTFIPSRKEIENKATDFLRTIGRYPDELSTGTINIIYLKYNPISESYTNVVNRSEANLVEIDFYRPNPDNVPVATPRFFNSQNFVVMLFDENGYQVVKSQIAFFEKSETQVDLYPVKSGDIAWQELLNGKGSVVAATMGKKDVTIKKMFISYYDPEIYQNYLQPVYVFLGDNDFVAYVPAITSEFLSE